MPAIEVEGLVKRYENRPAVDGLSFAVEPGEVFGLLGPNGAGKTTTVEILEGFRVADEGTVRVLGCDPRDDIRRLRPVMGVMPQSGDLQSGIRVAEAVRLFAAMYADPVEPSELLERLGLTRSARTSWRHLSGGERRKLSLALALVGRPDVAFLDEPTAGMDVHARAATWEIIRELRERGTAVLLTTHQLDEARHAADRVGIIHRGRLVALGPPDALGDRGEIRFRTDGSPDPSDLTEVLGVRVEAASAGWLRVDATPDPKLVARIASVLADRGLLITELRAGTGSLEDVFFELTREAP